MQLVSTVWQVGDPQLEPSWYAGYGEGMNCTPSHCQCLYEKRSNRTLSQFIYYLVFIFVFIAIAIQCTYTKSVPLCGSFYS